MHNSGNASIEESSADTQDDLAEDVTLGQSSMCVGGSSEIEYFSNRNL